VEACNVAMCVSVPAMMETRRICENRGALLLEAPARKVSHSIYEGARDLARDIANAKA
jgi:hypothetical protein